MDTNEIDRLALLNPLTRKIFKGCVACDELPRKKILKKFLPQSYIINLCARNNSHDYCHWVSLYISDVENIEYFDSAGMDSHMSNLFIRKFINKQNPKRIQFNKIQVQSNDSINCGIFSLVFLYAKAINIDFKRFVRLFKDKQLEQNDKIVENLFSCAFDNYQNVGKCFR